MNPADVLRRIERRLKSLGISANAASVAAGKPDAIRNLRRLVKDGGRQGLTMATLSALAPVLKTTVAWLAEGAGPEDIEATERTIPVWGLAGAGGGVNRFHEEAGPIDNIPAPDGANENTCALQISGESLGRLFDRWYAIYDEIRDPPTEDMIGCLCVLETARGQVYIKRLNKGRGRKFTLESNYESPINDVEVKWAAKVTGIIPR